MAYRMGWRLYFWVMAVFSVPGILWQGFPRVWEMLDCLVFVVMMAGLFGYSSKRRLGPMAFWRVSFPVSIAWNLIYHLLIPMNEVAAAQLGGMSQTLAGVISLVFCLPLFAALYFYVFRGQEIWNPPGESPASSP